MRVAWRMLDSQRQSQIIKLNSVNSRYVFSTLIHVLVLMFYIYLLFSVERISPLKTAERSVFETILLLLLYSPIQMIR